MNRKVFYISDFFIEQILGGGELNDNELLDILESKGYEVRKKNSHLVDISTLEQNRDCFFIVSNFCNLSVASKNYISKNLDYIVYEHDHKYVSGRNPAVFKNFQIPNAHLRNYFFYKNAIRVFCQSKFHKNILFQNLSLNNLVNVSGNLWSLETLASIRKLSKNEKQDVCSIMNSMIEHKNTRGCKEYAEKKKMDYRLIASQNYFEFLSQISKNKKFLFLPKTPETLSRVVVEARMLGCSVVTNELVGATGEEWFCKKGDELIDYMIEKRQEISNTIINLINKKSHSERPLVSIITTFHDGEKYIEHFMSNITTQTFFDKCELVIVDAASKGIESEIIRIYQNKYENIIYHRIEEKLKPTPCINKAIKLSSGKYITLALLDDVKSQDCVEKLYNHIEKKKCDLVYGEVIEVTEENQNFAEHENSNKVFEHSKFEFSRENMVKCLPGPMPLWRTNIHDDSGFFNEEEHDYADDWEMWLRMVSHGCVFSKLNEKIGLYLLDGRSQKNDLRQKKEEAQIFFRYSNLFGDNYRKFAPYFKQFLG